MNWKSKLWIFSILFWGCATQTSKDQLEEHSSYYSTEHLIEVAKLKEIIHHSDVKLLDIRKQDLYLQGHIIGARSLWRNELEDTTYAYGGMRPSKIKLTTLLQEKGIQKDDYIVLYDDNGACDAARVWWNLKLYGYENMAILNGGLTTWKNAGGTLTDELPVITLGTFTFPEVSESPLVIEHEEVLTAVNQSKALIVDARSVDEYTGYRQKKGALRAGRIPGSQQIDWVSAINYGGDMKFKSKKDLTQNYQVLIDSQEEIIVYCHTGVRSAHTFFVLTELIGLKNVKNYDGSWTEWSHYEQSLIEKDSITTLYQ